MLGQEWSWNPKKPSMAEGYNEYFTNAVVLPLLFSREHFEVQNPLHGQAWSNHTPNGVREEFLFPNCRECAL